MSKVFCFLILFTLAFSSKLLAAQDNDDESSPTASKDSESVAAGKALFQQKCGFCHGADGSGGEGPDLLHSSLVLHDGKGELIGPVVRGARQDKGMPAFQFSDIQVQEIAAFLHQEIKLDATIFYTNSTSNYPVERMLVGNAESGKSYFNGAGKCADCHSPSGDLAHIASKYKPIDLQTRIGYPRGAIPTVVVTLPSGKEISGEQVYADQFLMSMREADGWVHTWQRNKIKLQIHDPLAAHKALLSVYTDRIIHDLFAYLETLK
jgi:cytochrome c oxidase cbb3-type subunit III